MAAKLILFVCAIALVAQSVLGTGCGCGCRGCGCGCGGCGSGCCDRFCVRSNSAAPTGLSICSENRYNGDVCVCGEVPFLGTADVCGDMCSSGCGCIDYGCGDDCIGITQSCGGCGCGCGGCGGCGCGCGGCGGCGCGCGCCGGRRCGCGGCGCC
ncbi:chorion class high-cysteine HCB protein 13-like [Bombyx mandarina]|uniref:Chorion class high-cysteine HCB protein 13-like n=1 Tax=Bombyx mandarina TaxID=7092 RepID=A0A6J2JH30_BOMMA|nr:chorion class high-cysteine HCB protein 13-like [Bombyx mandarina]